MTHIILIWLEINLIYSALYYSENEILSLLERTAFGPGCPVLTVVRLCIHVHVWLNNYEKNKHRCNIGPQGCSKDVVTIVFK